jgi:hypothetical protein
MTTTAVSTITAKVNPAMEDVKEKKNIEKQKNHRGETHKR